MDLNFSIYSSTSEKQGRYGELRQGDNPRKVSHFGAAEKQGGYGGQHVPHEDIMSSLFKESLTKEYNEMFYVETIDENTINIIARNKIGNNLIAFVNDRIFPLICLVKEYPFVRKIYCVKWNNKKTLLCEINECTEGTKGSEGSEDTEGDKRKEYTHEMSINSIIKFYSILGITMPNVQIFKDLLLAHEKITWYEVPSRLVNKYNFNIDFQYFYYSANGLDPMGYTVRGLIKTQFSDKKIIIANKQKLYTAIRKNNRDAYIKYCDDFDTPTDLYSVKEIKKGSVYIIRPARKFLGSGASILIVTNERELAAAKETCRKNKFETVLINRYLPNPLLFDGKKMHFRMYWFCAGDKNGLFFNRLLPFGKILTAKKNYVYEDFHNKDIHDSHMKSTKTNYYFPNHYEKLGISLKDANFIYREMKNIIKIVANVVKKELVPYPESKYACDIFGVDFLVRKDTLIPLLLEINAYSVGYDCAGVCDQELENLFITKYYTYFIRFITLVLTHEKF